MSKKKSDTLPRLPRGMGTYSWRDEEHTRIQFRKMIGEEPDKKLKYVYGSTVQECNRKMAEAEHKYKEECRSNTVHDPHHSALSLKAAVLNWMQQYKAPQLKAKSYDTLEDTYNSHVKTAPFADKQIEHVTDNDIQNWLNSINEKLSDSTTKKCYKLIKMFFDFYFARRPYDSPMLTVHIPKKENEIMLDEDGHPIDPDTSKAVLTDEEMARFEAEARKEYAPGKGGYLHGLFLVFSMWSQLRYGEVLALQWKDVDLVNKSAYVYKEFSLVKDRSGDGGRKRKWMLSTAKTRAGIRLVYLSDQAVAALNDYKNRKAKQVNEDDFIFTTSSGKPISNQFLNDMLHTVLERAGIDTYITLHGLRHTGISFFLRHQVNPDVVAKMAGHSSREVTERIYYTIIQDQYRKEIEKINSKA